MKKIIGIMGPGKGARETDLKNAWELGNLIAARGWVLLTGGRNLGVMDAANRGAKAGGGLTVGILPDADGKGVSEAVDIAIITDMGSARNNINVLSAHVVVACGMGAGTASEVALAIKAGKPVILLDDNRESLAFFRGLAPELVQVAQTPEEAIEHCAKLLSL
ncbi:MAG TPA: cytochrome [Oscillatoriaceae cyanobacterium M33_DOE_052]|uniref:Cytochrome n=1 Tax=Planktothricoides sp. SpSt-374 TaxID=2282167 RepID=A0A7C3VH39_9CYAN|nr:cytochrome [Oscillatoriaceae cyanobacterium M33_DOE_052]